MAEPYSPPTEDDEPIEPAKFKESWQGAFPPIEPPHGIHGVKPARRNVTVGAEGLFDFSDILSISFFSLLGLFLWAIPILIIVGILLGIGQMLAGLGMALLLQLPIATD